MSNRLATIIVKKLDAPNSQAVHTVYTQVMDWLDKRDDIDVFLAEGAQITEDQEEEIGDRWPYVIAIGGDGTVIMAAKLAMQFRFAPVIGFNLGKVGFLVDYDPKSVHDSLDAVYGGDFKEDHREMLMAEIDGQCAGVGLNDIVVSCKDSDTSFQYDLHVQNAFAGTHLANGVIFSTPTGSTAYAIAVGGAIMMPDLEKVMQVVPIAAQTLASRPLMVRSDPGADLTFYVQPGRPVTVRVDGQIVATLEPSDKPVLRRIRISLCEKKAVLFHHKNWSHFETLTTKLGWNR